MLRDIFVWQDAVILKLGQWPVWNLSLAAATKQWTASELTKMLSGAVVRTLASHQCGPGSNPGVDPIHVCGLNLLLVLVLAPRGFSPCISVSPLLKNKHFQIPFRSGTHGHVSTTSWELLNAPWVKKCQVTIFLPMPNFYPSSSLYLGTGTVVPEFQRGYLKKNGCVHMVTTFFGSLANALKKIFHFML